jgi:hypothetical protein
MKWPIGIGHQKERSWPTYQVSYNINKDYQPSEISSGGFSYIRPPALILLSIFPIQLRVK